MCNAPLIDPRPLEPEWVTSMQPTASGMVEWSAQTVEYNKQFKKRLTRTAYNRGTPENLLTYIGSLTISPALEDIDITIDASQVTNTGKPASGWSHIKHLHDHMAIYWRACYSTPGVLIKDEEEGTQASDLIDMIAYILEEKGNCVLQLGPYDPTPEYSEIGSMF